MKVTSSDREGATVVLSLTSLDAMPQSSFTTTTIWTDSATTFSGVPLAAVLGAATGQTVELVALNDYVATMPLAEVEATAPIIATRMDGQTLSVRDKGPFWVVFPYDSDPKYQTETIYARSVWQLDRVNILE